jgi:aspartokinase
VNESDLESSTGEAVRQIIESDGAIKIGLMRGLINARALARYIQVLTHEKYSFEALVSAIRRYPIEATATKYEDSGKLISKLTMKNKIVVVAIRSAPEIPMILAKLSGDIDYGRGETFRVSSGAECITVVIDSKNLDKLDAVIPKDDIVSVLGNLSEITAVLSDNSTKTVGTAATMTAELAMSGVNILYIMSYGPPHSLVFVVKESDALKGYSGLQKLSYASV